MVVVDSLDLKKRNIVDFLDRFVGKENACIILLFKSGIFVAAGAKFVLR
jgi:hypothetical protein